MAHGMSGDEAVKCCVSHPDFCSDWAIAGMDLGIEPSLAKQFADWWDGGVGIVRKEWRAARAERLLSVLEDIWRERLEDALAVDEVLQPEPEGVLA